MLPTGYYDEILAKDVLEHLPRSDTRITLRGWHRLLKPGGIIRLRVPDLLSLLQKLESDPGNEWWEQCIYGTQAQEGDFHVAGFTLDLLIMYLKEVGFRDIELVKNDWLIEAIATRS